MALAMIGGLVAATVLTLTFLPALYALSFGASRAAGEDRPSMEVIPAQRTCRFSG